MRHWRARHGGHPWHKDKWTPRGRAAIVRRLAVMLLVLLTLSAAGFGTLLAWVLRQAGFASVPSGPAVPLATAAGTFAFVALFFVLAMRRIGLPFGDLVVAADRVAEGAFDTKVEERGPPYLRVVARAFNRMTSTLEAQDRQRKDLLADIAHELRTPLSVMQGRLEGVMDGVYDRSDAQIAELLDEARMLSRLVEDLGTLAHAERGVMALRREPTDIPALIDDVVQAMEPEARTRHVVLTVSAPDQDPVDVDPLRFREILLNLVANAIRHSHDGASVAIGADQRSDKLTITVRDTGPGMTAEDAAKVFDRFHKGPRSQGSGLGLAITKQLVEGHGGRVEVDSVLGAGTMFQVTVPVGHRR